MNKNLTVLKGSGIIENEHKESMPRKLNIDEFDLNQVLKNGTPLLASGRVSKHTLDEGLLI